MSWEMSINDWYQCLNDAYEYDLSLGHIAAYLEVISEEEIEFLY